MKFIVTLLLTTTLLSSCAKQTEEQHLVKIEVRQININQQLQANEVVSNMVAPYKQKLAEKMGIVLSHSTKDLKESDGALETTLGNFLADLCYEQAQPVFYQKTGKNIDFVLLNHGGMRAEIGKGEVTVGDAFKLMPFDNQLVVVELSADKIKTMVQYLIKEQRPHPISKQATLVAYQDGSYRFTINGKEPSNDQTYYVLTSDYLQTGGDKMLFLKDPIRLFPINYQIRDAIIDYFRANQTIDASLDGRFRLEEQES